MDMRSTFEFTVEGNKYETACETWQEVLDFVMNSMNEAGFTVDEKRHKAINELARSGKVTI